MKTNDNQAVASAVAMQREMLSAVQDGNNVLTTGQVKSTFQGHAFNMESGKHGIANLIAEILTEREAIFAKGIETTELRPVAIAASMFTEEIIAEVQHRFSAGTTRYPYNTIHMYLSVFMRDSGKHSLANLPRVRKIKLSNEEDKPRKSAKPRGKWYLIQN